MVNNNINELLEFLDEWGDRDGKVVNRKWVYKNRIENGVLKLGYDGKGTNVSNNHGPLPLYSRTKDERWLLYHNEENYRKDIQNLDAKKMYNSPNVKNPGTREIDNSPNIEKFGTEQIDNSPRTLQAQQGVREYV